jgi:mucin-19
MPYIGNQPQYTSFLTDTFSGNGVTTVFNMRVAPASAAAAIVAVSGVLQDPLTYSVLGNILTFSQAPPTGSGNISVRYLSLPASNVVNSAYRSVTDITATAGQTTFSTSSYTPGFVEVFRNGVRLGASNFTATSGVTVVLGSPANAGDLVTVVSFFISSVINAIPGTAGAVTANNLDVSQQGGVGAMALPAGSTGQRPITPSAGMWRHNSTAGVPEVYTGTSWETPFCYPVQALVVAGGGAGGQDTAGGGGGGGVIYNPAYEVIPGVTYIVTVGSGGTRPTGGGQLAAAQGGNSSFTSTNFLNTIPLVAIGGGGGTGSANTGNAGDGGNGGGAGNSTGRGGSGAYGQGNYGNATAGAAGGGGAGQSPLNGANGSNGAATYITGSLSYYGGGGAGNSGTGGLGGGGVNGGFQAASNNGTANTGGGGSGFSGSWNGAGNGGSGIVIISYQAAAQRATGGTVTTYVSGGTRYYVHTFTSSGTFLA